MNRQGNISLCMIVKDEENFIANCLQSVQDVVDEIIIIDTGSTDKTTDIANTFDAKIYHLPWDNNFSAARNFSLEKATSKWIMILDADEELNPLDKSKLKKLINNKDIDAYYLKIYNYLGKNKGTTKLVDARISLFRNNQKYRYQGAIHEEIENSIVKNNGRIKFSDLVINHYGYLDETIDAKNKTNRNKKIILEELKKEKENIFLNYALATEYLQDKKYKEAFVLFQEAIAIWNPNHPNYSDALYKLCYCLYELKEYDNCKIWINIGVKLFPEYTDLYYLRGSLEKVSKEWRNAEASFQKCIFLGPAPNQFYSLDGTGTYRAWYALGLIYEIINQTDKAIDSYLNSLKINPKYNEAFSRLIQTAITNMKKEEFSDFIQKHFNLKNAVTLYAIGKMLIRFNRFDYLLYLTKSDDFKANEQNFLCFSQLCEFMANKVSTGTTIFESRDGSLTHFDSV